MSFNSYIYIYILTGRNFVLICKKIAINYLCATLCGGRQSDFKSDSENINI